MENTSTQKPDEAIASVLNPDEEIASTQKTDEAIIDEYFARDEQAITSTSSKYGAYCGSIAYNILENREDAEECVNDTYLSAWNSIPPTRPTSLSAFLGKITRNGAIGMLRKYGTLKRGGSRYTAALDEIADSLSSPDDIENDINGRVLTEAINRFLGGLGDEKRNIFIQRYFYLDSVSEIASYYGLRESKVKTSLFRTRNALCSYLEKEGLI